MFPVFKQRSGEAQVRLWLFCRTSSKVFARAQRQIEKESELQSNRRPWRNLSLHQGLIYAQVMDLTAVWGEREMERDKKRKREEITCSNPHVYLYHLQAVLVKSNLLLCNLVANVVSYEQVWFKSFHVRTRKRNMQMDWPEPVIRFGKTASDRLDINIWNDWGEIALHTGLL